MVPEDILIAKREIDSELLGEEQSWSRAEANVSLISAIKSLDFFFGSSSIALIVANSISAFKKAEHIFGYILCNSPFVKESWLKLQCVF